LTKVSFHSPTVVWWRYSGRRATHRWEPTWRLW